MPKSARKAHSESSHATTEASLPVIAETSASEDGAGVGESVPATSQAVQFPEDAANSDVVDQATPSVEISEAGPEYPAHEVPALARRMEALLFVSSKPLSARRIAELLGLTSVVPVRQAAAHLATLCSGHAFELRDTASGYQFMTMPDVEADVLKLQRQKRAQQMTPGALETLAVIAYKQPITRTELEAIRGMSSDHHIRALLERDLIRVAGRKTDGKFGGGAPALYGTTSTFLTEFGLSSLSELPHDETVAAAPGNVSQAES